MHKIKIDNDRLFLDDFELQGIINFALNADAEHGSTLTVSLDVYATNRDRDITWGTEDLRAYLMRMQQIMDRFSPPEGKGS